MYHLNKQCEIPCISVTNTLMLFTLLTYDIAGHAQNIPAEITDHKNWKLLDRREDCGYSIGAERIIGGNVAYLGQYPWMARLGFASETFQAMGVPERFECSGTVISGRYVLTAAHCCNKIANMDLIEVQLGEHNETSEKDCQKGRCAPDVQRIEIEQKIIHNHYDSSTYLNDICLLRLATKINFTEFVVPICLPVYDSLQNDTFDKTIMEVAGWGVKNKHGETSEVLLTLKVPVVNFQTCEKNYLGKQKLDPTQQLCAGGVVGEDSCNGDSGGPLMKPFTVRNSTRYFIIGVVSFGPIKCAATGTPGIYIAVSKYLKWILDNIHE